MYPALVRGIDGVDATTYPVLSGLLRMGPTTATALAAEIGLDRSVVTRYLSRLESSGYVDRAPDGSDGRATRIELTPQGTAVVHQLRQELRTVCDGILDSWEPDDGDRFAADLERFVGALLGAAVGRDGDPS
ncbi:putative MarR family transcriptional regulator [Gordonia soli NBRC 108243]|uniref:Putative MarR family transcriptional regulator n=1 Tax=Gordonia soli NBRC 108243 TaxID=1223545 RepID=M0QMD7_9ACTN|nr:putative MarR family transcriptional regulator [Gordonia soli NBRC 108243]